MEYQVNYDVVRIIVDADNEEDARWEAQRLIDEIAEYSSFDYITKY